MKIALAQTEPLWEDKEGNFKAALTFLERAREQKADLVLFPEMSMTGFSMHPEKIGETGENPRTLSFFREQAERYGLYIGVGYVELCEPKSFNRYAVLSPRGGSWRITGRSIPLPSGQNRSTTREGRSWPSAR